MQDNLWCENRDILRLAQAITIDINILVIQAGADARGPKKLG